VLPNLPTVAEDFPGFEASGWLGYFMPAKTPRDIFTRIARETAKALAASDLQDRLRAIGNEPVGSTPEEFEAKFKADLVKFARVVREAQIPPQD
jgi:tripartite-type tricarboxylate transporter receptor subunit TctC